MLKCVFTEPKLTEELLSEEELFQSSLGRKIIDIIFELYGLNGDFSLGQVSDRLEPDESKYISKALDNIAVAGNAEEIMRQCVDKQKISRLKSREERVLAMLSMADEEYGIGAETHGGIDGNTERNKGTWGKVLCQWKKLTITM